MKTVVSICFVLFTLTVLAQPTRLELGIRRNAAQTLMGSAKLETYKKDKSIYAYADSVFFCIEFNGDEYCSGFFWSGKDESNLEKTITENGFTKNDSIYTAPDFPGYFKKEDETTPLVYRYFSAPLTQPTVKAVAPIIEETPKEKPFYGFTVFGAKVWEKKEAH